MYISPHPEMRHLEGLSALRCCSKLLISQKNYELHACDGCLPRHGRRSGLLRGLRSDSGLLPLQKEWQGHDGVLPDSKE